LNTYNINESFGSIVHWAERALLFRLNGNFKKGGFRITTEQHRLLVHLWNQEGQNQQELAGVTRKDKTSITRIIRGLEKKDLIVRVTDRIDRRMKLLYLTEKGRETAKELIKIAQWTTEEAKAGISEEKIRICENVLQKVLKNLRK
jgi:DNA-binding MarR family transcriptional regulator